MAQCEDKALFYTSDKRSLYLGRVEPLIKRTTPSAVLLLSLEGELVLHNTASKAAFVSRSLLIPPGADIVIDTAGAKVVQCFLDDFGIDFARLVPQMQAWVETKSDFRIYGELKQIDHCVEQAYSLLRLRPSHQVAFTLLEQWIGNQTVNQEVLVDHRVIRAVSVIKETYAENIPVEAVATTVGLSVPRLSQLFKQFVGVPIRKFRLWCRLVATTVKIGQGYSLTDAAIACGFTDYPQLCRVFRELTGIRPSEVRNNTDLRIVPQLGLSV